MVRDILRHEWTSFQFQRLGLSEKIPSVVLKSFETLGFAVHVILCVVCVAWAVQNELLKLFISPCELIWMLFLLIINMWLICEFC